MSAIDVEGQSAALAGINRAAPRSGGAGQSASDDGAFGAVMAGLESGPTPAAKSAPPANPEASADADASKTAEPAGRSLEDLLSSILTQDEDAGAMRPRRTAGHAQKTDGHARKGVPDAVAGSGDDHEEAADGAQQAHGGRKAKSDAGADVAADVTQPLQTPQAALMAEAISPAQQTQADGEGDHGGRSRRDAARHAASDVSDAPDTGDADVPTMRVTVLRRETHFAPVADFAASAGDAGEKADAARQTETPSSSEEAMSPRERAAQRLEQARGREQGNRDGQTPSEARHGIEAGAANANGVPVEGEAGETNWAGTASLPLASLRQVSTAIGAEVARLVDPSFTAGTDPGASRMPGGPLRLLDIQLHPLDLGRVTVRMRLGDDGLDVRISASNPATARMLQQDQARLTELLRAQGIEAANVTVVDPSDQGAAWTRFEGAPRASGTNFTGQGERDQGSDRQQGQQNSGNGRNEGESAPGGRRSGRNRG